MVKERQRALPLVPRLEEKLGPRLGESSVKESPRVALWAKKSEPRLEKKSGLTS